MANLLKYAYQGSEVTFFNGDNVMVNATQMAKAFGKQPHEWLRLPSTKEFLDELTEVRKSNFVEYQTVITKNCAPEYGGGTWLTEDAALEFARWLSPSF